MGSRKRRRAMVTAISDRIRYGSEIQTAVAELEAAYGQRNIRVRNLSSNHVGVYVTVPVDIPTRGPVGGIDIREYEPILIVFHKTRYPHSAPRIYATRDDFPADQLPHLNPVAPGEPAWLCLHRGNIDDWFAEHSLIELIKRSQGWFRDAASDRLNRDTDFFEPTRINIEQLSGLAIYPPPELEEYLKENWEKGVKSGFAALPCRVLNHGELSSPQGKPFPSIKIGRPITVRDRDGFEQALSSAISFPGPAQDKAQPLVGILVWDERSRVCEKYLGRIPNDLTTLIELADLLGLPLADALDKYRVGDWNPKETVPLILAIQRPRPLIGSESSLEFLNLLLCTEGFPPDENGWKPKTPVWTLWHRSPLSIRLARELSCIPTKAETGRLLVIGCGALGSKIGLHLARGGITDLTLVDKHSLSPHNLVRHSLLAQSIGANKAVGLKRAIDSVFAQDLEAVGVQALQADALDILFDDNSQLLSEHSQVLDCSASKTILNALADKRRGQVPRVLRCELADQGRLGFLLIEGENRNPRVDDIQMLIYDRAIEDDRIADWLQRHQGDKNGANDSALEEITIGLGCSSMTMRMADDIVSFHAAAAAMTIKEQAHTRTPYGGVQISFCGGDTALRSSVEFLDLAKTRILIPKRARGWSVRLNETLFSAIMEQMGAAGERETGGLLLGFIHYTRKTIYVTRILEPPPDSKGTPYAFRLGVTDVPEKLIKIHKRTGGLIDYVGEWHSHPHGTNRLSSKDKAAVRQITTNLKPRGIPTHVMLVTSKGCFSHLFNHH